MAEDLETQLKRIEKQINEEINKGLTLEKLFNDEFIKKNTRFNTFEEFDKEAKEAYAAKRIKQMGY